MASRRSRPFRRRPGPERIYTLSLPLTGQPLPEGVPEIIEVTPDMLPGLEAAYRQAAALGGPTGLDHPDCPICVFLRQQQQRQG